MKFYTQNKVGECVRIAGRPCRTFSASVALVSFLFFPQIAIAEGGAPASVVKSTGSTLDRNPLDGPDSADSLLSANREEKADLLDRNFQKNWEAWKAGIKERTGFSFGADYTVVGLAATASLGDDTAASAIARVYGSWALFNRGAKNTGSIEFKGENRHSFTDVPPAGLGLVAGYVGVTEPVFSDQGFRATTLYWKQRFLDDKAVARVGLIDIKEYFDVYALASPWTGFHNLAFSTGSNTMIKLPDGAFGAMVGGYFSDNIYAAASIADASADPTSPFQSVQTFFGDFDTFKTIEIGYTEGGKRLFLDNAHIAFWQIDESKKTGATGGWGVNGSVSSLVNENLLVFLRGGWAHEGGGLYEASVSTGFGYMNTPGGNLLGVGVNWGRPNSDTIPSDLDDQWTGEVFYRVQLVENVQVTPSTQLLFNPALNPNEDLIAVFGMRGRVEF